MKQKIFVTVFTVMAITVICGCQQNRQQSDQKEMMDSIAVYREKARMGDSTAYLTMAELWLRDENVERGTFWALIMASQAEEWGAIESWADWALSLPKYLPVHHVTEVLRDVAVHRFDDARAKGKRLQNEGFHPGWIEAVIAMERHEKEKAASLCKQMTEDGSLLGRLLYGLSTNDKDSMLAVVDELPMLYIQLAEKARYEEHGKDPDELSENVPKYYLKADEYACLNREGARLLLSYYEYLLCHDSLAVSPEEFARIKRLNQ